MVQTSALLDGGAPRVLLLTDQELVASIITLTLNHGAFVVRNITDEQEATALLVTWKPHVAIVDMDVECTGLLGKMRPVPNAPRLNPPALALTRRGDLRTKLDAFDLGVDDVMTVPFSPEELLARTLVIMHRVYGQHQELAPVLQVGALEIDIMQRTVKVGGHLLHLSGLELSLLYLLAANAGRVVTRNEILDTLWGADHVAESNIVDRQVRNLRVRLQNNWRRPRFIETVPGLGYRFLPQDEG